MPDSIRGSFGDTQLHFPCLNFTQTEVDAHSVDSYSGERHISEVAVYSETKTAHGTLRYL
jgi:hypothetical protein